jgi:hypothetical protein
VDRSSKHRARLALVVAALTVFAVLALPPIRGTAIPSRAIGFSSPVVVDPTHAYGEPDVKIAPGGTTWYDSGPWGTGTQRSIWNWSTDAGHTFHSLHSPAIGSPSESDTNVPCPNGFPPPCPGGGDTEISIDRSGKVYYADLAALTTLKVATWDPAAKSMNTDVIVNGQQGGNGYDRQWFANWDPAVRPADYTGPLPVNYLVYAEAEAGCCEAAAYTTDGTTYGGPTVEYSISLDGNAVIDQETGTVLEGVAIAGQSDIGVAILTRDPANPSDPALTSAQLVHIADTNDQSAGSYARCLLPIIALDQSDNAYVSWCTRNDNVTQSGDSNAWQIWYAYAPKPWTSWSAPIKLSRSPSNQNVMPWVVAGAGGRLAAVWYGTDDATHQPSVDDVHQSWDVYLAIVANANTSKPTITQVKVTRHPMHYGTICLEGLGCIEVQGNRNLADFFQVDEDPTNGAVIITYNDTSNELVQEVPPIPEGFVDHRGAPQVMVVRQNSGVGLLGTSVTGDPRTAKSITDGLYDATFDPVYSTSNIPETDLASVTVKADPLNPLNLKFDLYVGDLANPTNALSATRAGAIDYVVRFVGPAVVDPNTGAKNPIYFAAAELVPGGAFTFYAGEAESVDLCSVSACTPHVINYAAPPQGGILVTGSVVGTVSRYGKDYVEIVVPRAVLGGLSAGSLMESLSGYVLARNKSASLTITTAEAEGGITPIEVDGACCRDVTSP